MSTLDKLKEAVRGVAPTLAASLVPGGPLVAAAVKTIGEAVLGKPHATPEELIPAVQALTPEAQVKLAQSDNELRAHLATLDYQKDALVIEDRTDARARDVALRKAGEDNVRGDVLAYAAIGSLILAVAASFLVALYGSELGPQVGLLIGNLTGALIVIVKDVYGFEFGSSRGSKEKTDAMSGRRGK